MKKFNPFKRLSQWAQNHHDFLSSFVSGFAATVLGIVLTFGTTMWYEHKQKQEAAEALVERCLSNMETRLDNLKGIVELYEKHDQLYSITRSRSLDTIGEDTLGYLIDVYTNQTNVLVNHAYEKSFSQSVTSHEILGEYAKVIGDGFEYLLYAEQKHEEVNALKLELRRQQILERNTYWDKGSFRDVVSTAFADPHFVYFQDEFVQRENSVRHLYSFLKIYIPEARRLWNGEITKKEFQDKTTKGWDEWYKAK